MVIRVPEQRNRLGGYAVLDDRLLVLDFQAGNPQAFVEIHHRYGPLARRVCQRFLPNAQDVDEAFQETMIRVYQGLYGFNGRYALQPWVARIAKNVSLDILRGRARRPQNDDRAPVVEDLPGPDDEAEQIVERLVQHDTVLAVLSDLPETHRRALMLRELDGRSHREIAQEMEISTGQAKALIHRAKVSFRRRWLEKVAERGGLMGIAFVPLIWLARLADGVRRVGDRFGHAAQAAQAAAPEAVTSTVSATAAPVVSGGTERLVAAGMTLLLAGGVTVGAARIVKSQTEDRVARAVAETVAETPSTSSPRVDRPVIDDPFPDKGRIGDHQGIDAEPPVGVEPVPSPVIEPSPAPDPSPSPQPVVDPGPTPSPPAPDWSLSFTSSVAIGDPQLELLKTRVNGRAGANILFSQTASGPLVAAKGREVGHLYVEYWGSAEGPHGSSAFWIFLDTPDGRYRYDASATLESISGPDGTSTYTFRGAYQLVDWPGSAEGVEPSPDVPNDGAITLALGFWSDETTLYRVELGLAETPATAGAPAADEASTA